MLISLKLWSLSINIRPSLIIVKEELLNHPGLLLRVLPERLRQGYSQIVVTGDLRMCSVMNKGYKKPKN